MTRVHTFWIAVAAYVLGAAALYGILAALFPAVLHQHSDLIFSVAWLPLGAAACWLKNWLEDRIQKDSRAAE